MDPIRHRQHSPGRGSNESTPRSSTHLLSERGEAAGPRTSRYVHPNPIFPRSGQEVARTRSPPPTRYELSTNLSKRGRRFVDEVPEADYKTCYEHISNHPELLKESNKESNYGAEAIAALREGNERLARNCVEKGLLRGDLQDKTWVERDTYFNLLHSKDTRLTRLFQSNFDKALARLKQEGSVIGKQSAEAESRDVTVRRPSFRTERPVALASWASEEAVRSLETRTSKMSIEEPARIREERHKDRPSVPGPDPRTQPGLQGIPKGRHPEQSGERKYPRHDPGNAGDTRDEVGSYTSQHSWRPPTDIRAHGSATKDQIDGRFHQRFRKDAQAFWCRGRVFALIAHSEYTGKESLNQLSQWHTRTNKGQIIVSKVTRMAVVKVGNGYVWAIPINTYGGQGVAKSGFKKVHIDAHAIIHDSQSSAQNVNDLEPHMKKHPIAVDLLKDQELHKASRINFAKVHTVEWNVRAMEVGVIANKSWAYFTRYWKEAMDR